MKQIAKGDKVYGAPGVFYADEEGVGTVLNLLNGDLARVELLDGDRAVVPIDLLVEVNTMTAKPPIRVIRDTDDSELPLVGRVTGYDPNDPDVVYVAWGDASDDEAVAEFTDAITPWDPQ